MKINGSTVRVLLGLGLGFGLLLPAVLAGQAAAQEDCIPPPPGLVHWWPGDGNTSDVVGGLAGTLENGATFAPGNVDQAFSLDGIDDFVSMADYQFPPDVTIAAWIRPDRVLDEMIIATAPSIQPPWPESGLFLSAGPPGPQLRYFVDPDGGNRGYWYALYPFVEGQWYHVAVTQSGPSGLPALYIDSVSYPVVIDGLLGSPYRTTAPLSVGRDGAFDSSYFQGALDEIQVYKRALSSEEISAIFRAGSAGNCPVRVEPASWGSVKRLYE